MLLTAESGHDQTHAAQRFIRVRKRLGRHRLTLFVRRHTDCRWLQRVPVILNHLSRVIAGLVPAIHALLAEAPQERRDVGDGEEADSTSTERALEFSFPWE